MERSAISMSKQMKEVRFFVNGLPSPGGSKSAFCLKKNGIYTGRAVVVDAGGAKTKLWRQEVAKAAMLAMKQADLAPFTGPIELELIFQMPRPQSHFGTRHGMSVMRAKAPPCHVIRPDVTKLVRSTEDSLTGKCWLDDAQVVKQQAEKAYSEQVGAWVVIREAGK
jgi:Holliday junction resolvase RusA-like endonuclease